MAPTTIPPAGPPATLEEARSRDAADPLGHCRERFAVPVAAGGHPSAGPVAYLCGNSLGLMPRTAPAQVAQVLEDWATLAVDAHFEGDRPWFGYEEAAEALLAPLVGAAPCDVALGNALTVDLHLMMASFYRPTGRRRRILIEGHAFPSDRYAVAAQAAWHGLDPDDAVVEVAPDGDGRLRPELVAEAIGRYGDELALVLLGGVNYLTGEVLDVDPIIAAARAAGAIVGLDLAHAVGNVPCDLPGWDVDFAAWCTYKYLNGGPGSVAAWYVAARHGGDGDLPRLAGWWGNDPDRRFRMVSERRFAPRAGAAGWKVSNPSILGVAPLLSSLALFAEADPALLRSKSVALTGDLMALLDGVPGVRIVTPREPAARGCQVSIRVPNAADVHRRLHAEGVIGDLREPDVIRLAPTPLYNGWVDVWRAAEALRSAVRPA
jgi:kynureninase